MKNDYWITYVEVGNEELYPVKVFYDSSPPEPDVNWPGSLEIEGVEFKGEDITAQVASEEMESLQARTDEYLNAMAEDSRY